MGPGPLGPLRDEEEEYGIQGTLRVPKKETV